MLTVDIFSSEHASFQNFWNLCKDIPGISPAKFRKPAYSELEIFTVNIISVMKWGNEKTDRKTRNMKLF